MNKISGKIYETTKYDMFKKLEGNRHVNYSYQLENAVEEVVNFCNENFN